MLFRNFLKHSHIVKSYRKVFYHPKRNDPSFVHATGWTQKYKRNRNKGKIFHLLMENGDKSLMLWPINKWSNTAVNQVYFIFMDQNITESGHTMSNDGVLFSKHIFWSESEFAHHPIKWFIFCSCNRMESQYLPDEIN